MTATTSELGTTTSTLPFLLLGVAGTPDGPPAPQQAAVGAIPSAEVFGTPSLATTEVSLVGIPSAEALGALTATAAGSAATSVGGVGSSADVGSPTFSIVLSAQTITVGGIPSTTSVGAPTVVVGAAVIGVGGIPSSAAVGSPTFTAGAVVQLDGIPSAASFGTPALLTSLIVTTLGIHSREVFGWVRLSGGAVQTYKPPWPGALVDAAGIASSFSGAGLQVTGTMADMTRSMERTYDY